MNRSIALQFWIIAAIVPVALMLTGDSGKYDFAAFWVAGKQALAGTDVYSLASTKVFADRFTNGASLIFLYPPHALFFFIPFALVPYIPGYWLWNAATAAFFYWAARPYCPEGFPRILAVLTPAALTWLNFGQTGL
ncbi:MAG TPA: glycosyltransferase family 87 protein, partial [Steroidobacteraceae bacterium]|nr:glycosyltransferase family 87 protein [Steroidobacteraceae bacterium]